MFFRGRSVLSWRYGAGNLALTQRCAAADDAIDDDAILLAALEAVLCDLDQDRRLEILRGSRTGAALRPHRRALAPEGLRTAS